MHAFIAPKLIGGQAAPGPVGALGRALLSEAYTIGDPAVQLLGGDIYVSGRRSESGYNAG